MRPDGIASVAFVAAFLCGATAAAQHHDAPAPEPRYTRTTAVYSPPDVPLRSGGGTPTHLAAVLGAGGSMFLQFIFTSCPAVCPVMSASFAGVQSRLGSGDARLRFVSISIDPAYDTPDRLRDYAKRFHAGAQWQFFTGNAEDIAAVQKAFATYPGNNKMRHVPVTFFRAGPGLPWVRLEGLLNAGQLLGEYRGTMN
ncbi:MAG TPA: SCO family protein [Thermoanaerobaculia bacterium]|jgi:protein SCO1/2|nr:SCO family protein [Thermoanaerobaculia bacterium]